MLNVTIDRTAWVRGDPKNSWLLDTNGHRCCIGFLAQALGLKDKDLIGQPTLKHTFDEASPHNACLRTFHADNLHRISTAYHVNDTPDLTEPLREQRIIELGTTMGVNFRFEGGS